MNVNPYNTPAYENKSDWTLGENKPNSNPIKPKKMLLRVTINGRFSAHFLDSEKINVLLDLFHLMSLFKLDSLQREKGGEKRVFVPYKAFPHRKIRSFHGQNTVWT